MLLFPDMSRDQHEAQEFCFCDPCTKEEWRKLKHQVVGGEGTDKYLPFVFAKADSDWVCVILRGTYDTDDECLTTAAWIRLVREFTGMIYALPFREGRALTAQTMSAIIARTSGVPYHQVRHIKV